MGHSTKILKLDFLKLEMFEQRSEEAFRVASLHKRQDL